MKDKQLAAFRNKNAGFVFQSFHLINSLNVMDNVELPLLYRRISNSERKRLGKKRSTGKSRIKSSYESLPLRNFPVVSASVWQ